MQREDVHCHINEKAPHCEHMFIATNTKKTEHHEAVTQMACMKCLLLVNFEDIASGVEKYRACKQQEKADELAENSTDLASGMF